MIEALPAEEGNNMHFNSEHSKVDGMCCADIRCQMVFFMPFFIQEKVSISDVRLLEIGKMCDNQTGENRIA